MLDRPNNVNLPESGGKETGLPQPAKDVPRSGAAGGAFPPETAKAQSLPEAEDPRHGDPLYA